ncbi:hypothetical protein HMN09_00804500 [Mycena chlorophos]|uniref:Golgi apparatus membrane protein TVP38 n=1 Tax=Mycena chlorophos TaxID=658473 RepID=A0A8H6SVN2_MYCCL|nr:hypothetical protein HMN09_00804500 [Mycena chlorophos]
MSNNALSMPHPVYGQFPPKYSNDASTTKFETSSWNHSQDSMKGVPVLDVPNRDNTRTPEPTVEEYNLLHGINPPLTQKQKLVKYSIYAFVIGIVVLTAIFSNKIVNALKPETSWLRDHAIGPLIPIVILIIISFPPLFGQEIVGIIVGLTWDLGTALAIFATGTLLGEIANFVVFKYACTGRMAKYQEKSLDFGLTGHVVRRGGLIIVIGIRLSLIPSHYATAVFATVGLPFYIFLLGAIITLPMSLVTVYYGYAQQPGHTQSTSLIENVILIASVAVTVIAVCFIRMRMRAAREEFVYERRKARQAKNQMHGGSGQDINISLPV